MEACDFEMLSWMRWRLEVAVGLGESMRKEVGMERVMTRFGKKGEKPVEGEMELL